MEFNEHIAYTYTFTEEEETTHREMLYSVYTYLTRAGYKTFSLTEEQFDHLKYFVEQRYDIKPQETVIVVEDAQVTRESNDYSYKKKESKRKKK